DFASVALAPRPLLDLVVLGGDLAVSSDRARVVVDGDPPGRGEPKPPERGVLSVAFRRLDQPHERGDRVRAPVLEPLAGLALRADADGRDRRALEVHRPAHLVDGERRPVVPEHRTVEAVL